MNKVRTSTSYREHDDAPSSHNIRPIAVAGSTGAIRAIKVASWGVFLALCGAIPGVLSGATSVVLPGNINWGSENSNGGSSTITATAPRSGTGSLELYGDRTRFFGLGNPYSQSSNLGLLSAITDFRFDWMVAIGSAQGTTPNYSPALRLHIWDNGVRSELIWENAYNGPTIVTQGTWYSSASGDRFHRWVNTTNSPTLSNGALVTIPLSSWMNPVNGWYSANAYIAAISVGVGSSAGASYHAFADNVVLGTDGTSTTYNFEVPVPDTTCPIISNIQLPSLVTVNTGVYLAATIDDTTTGGSSIASSSYSINGSLPVAMAALDGGFDEINEDVTTFLSFSTPGIYTIKLSGVDSAGNTCTEQVMIVVYDPSAGFVTGGGWIDSPIGAFTGPDALQTKWYQPFSGDTTGWFGSITSAMGDTALVEGSAYSYFDIALPPADDRKIWPGTWIAEIDVYLDPSWASGKGFDYSVASSKSDGAHLRDFIFHVGTVENYGPVVGKALLVNGSNNTDGTVNPFKLVNENGGNYFVVTTAGWYRLQHRFRDAGGYLAVDLNLLDSVGAVVWTATRSNVADTLPGVVGNGRYGWFIFAAGTGGFEVDNHRRLVFGPTYPSGRANFGFVSKYKKGATVPEGSTEFVFQAGGLNFHSSAYEWLVVNQNGTNAQFKGTGRINGAGNYGFMIWASDNGNGGATDTFRIQIVDKDNGDATVYDNGVQQTLGGGNILIQTKK